MILMKVCKFYDRPLLLNCPSSSIRVCLECEGRASPGPGSDSKRERRQCQLDQPVQVSGTSSLSTGTTGTGRDSDSETLAVRLAPRLPLAVRVNDHSLALAA